MFFDDEAFEAVVLGGNFFRVAGLSTTFAPPPICRDDRVPAAVSTNPKPQELGTVLLASAGGNPLATMSAETPQPLRLTAILFGFAALLAAVALAVKAVPPGAGGIAAPAAKEAKGTCDDAYSAEDGPRYVELPKH